jgi:sulfonate transport system ATP-binding protein
VSQSVPADLLAPGSQLSLRRVSKSYRVDGRTLPVLSELNLDVKQGEFVSVVGASGCGKSTLLRLIAGLERDLSGEILLDGKRISGTSLSRGIVFQDHRLLPWMTLHENVLLALENVGMPLETKRARVREHIALVGLNGFENAYPHQLSGGMAQRAAIARGLVAKRTILLLDEPLGALDALTRLRLQDELLRIWTKEKITIILVTHDVEEAVYLSQKVIVMQARPGRISREFTVSLPGQRDRASIPFVPLRKQILSEMGYVENDTSTLLRSLPAA